MGIAKKKLRRFSLAAGILLGVYIFGVFDHLFETDFYSDFHYPYDGDVELLVEQLKNNISPEVLPINSYYFKYTYNCAHKCKDVNKLRIVYVVKSSPENFDRRIAIRSTWGFEKRFSDVEIRVVFLIGERKNNILESSLDEEYRKFKDVVKANFTDTYFNNTYKTMMGMQWVVKYCPNSEFYMFVDDDYYVSTKNVLRFLRYPTNYPEYLQNPFNNAERLIQRERLLQTDADDMILYAGYVFQSSPHRHWTSKWYVSLKEYPYHKWPPYVTAGAYVLSKNTLINMFYTSLYTKHFRFDDIYMGLLAYKAKIVPFHCNEFHFYKKLYDKNEFQYTVATHGYGEPKELLHIWTEQKSMGNA